MEGNQRRFESGSLWKLVTEVPGKGLLIPHPHCRRPKAPVQILTCRLTSSGIPSANTEHTHYERRRAETTYGERPTMASALVSPNAPSYHHHHHHHQHHNSFSSGYPHSAPAASISGMISPVEPRRSSDDAEPPHPHRQSLPSLPSISEVFSDRKALSYAQPPSSTSMPAQSLPSPFSSSVPSRPFGDVASPDKNPSPRTLQPTSTFPRTESLPAFSDPSRPVLVSRPVPPPLNTFPGQHPSPPVKMEHLEAEQRHAEAQSLSAGHRAPPPQALPGLYSEPSRLPPGQLPLSAYPISPRHSGHPLSSPYEAPRPSTYSDEGEFSHHHRPSDYKADFDKHFQTHGYQDALQIVCEECCLPNPFTANQPRS